MGYKCFAPKSNEIFLIYANIRKLVTIGRMFSFWYLRKFQKYYLLFSEEINRITILYISVFSTIGMGSISGTGGAVWWYLWDSWIPTNHQQN